MRRINSQLRARADPPTASEVSRVSQTIDGLEQKSDNLEAMNQNLEGRINMLASEKDKLNKAYAQIKAKQSTLEKEHVKLKKKVTSQEVAYKNCPVNPR